MTRPVKLEEFGVLSDLLGSSVDVQTPPLSTGIIGSGVIFLKE